MLYVTEHLPSEIWGGIQNSNTLILLQENITVHTELDEQPLQIISYQSNQVCY